MSVKDHLPAVGAATVSTGAVLTAAVTGACCAAPAVAPLFLTILGANGLVFMAGLRPYTLWFLAGSAAFLAFGFWLVYRKPLCGTRVARVLLWVSSAFWIAAASYTIFGLLYE